MHIFLYQVLTVCYLEYLKKKVLFASLHGKFVFQKRKSKSWLVWSKLGSDTRDMHTHRVHLLSYSLSLSHQHEKDNGGVHAKGSALCRFILKPAEQSESLSWVRY